MMIRFGKANAPTCNGSNKMSDMDLPKHRIVPLQARLDGMIITQTLPLFPMSSRAFFHTIACLAMFTHAMPVSGATDPWDMPPTRYSDTESDDPIARLGREIKSGRLIGKLHGLDLLLFVLNHLGIPPESQILVFSKTSKQNNLIHPQNPRALFFHENAYVGYVPGGDVEVIAHDPQLGAVFYQISPGEAEGPPLIRRDTSSCLSCHANGRTENAPGVLIRSVFPDQEGHPILPLGTFDIDATTPLPERWGGYYVTGQSSLPHLGNRTFTPATQRQMTDTAIPLASLRDTIPTRRYPRETSDIVALMVLEHQCHVHNLISSASLQYRRFAWLHQALYPGTHPDQAEAGRVADLAAVKIVEALLFVNEADLAEGIEGDPTFQTAFSQRFPKTQSGKSLADFHLQSRLFKNRCSYMIYSHVFTSAPSRLQSAITRQLRDVLTAPTAPPRFSHLPDSERKRIIEILSETLPAWKQP
jgi:hypothetical protein